LGESSRGGDSAIGKVRTSFSAKKCNIEEKEWHKNSNNSKDTEQNSSGEIPTRLTESLECSRNGEARADGGGGETIPGSHRTRKGEQEGALYKSYVSTVSYQRLLAFWRIGDHMREVD